jgi:hypothetical protein
MDCRTCQPTLLDLAHGELAPELAVTVREHVRGCASCSAALTKLESGLIASSQMAWLEPPAALRVNAMALAERHLQDRARQAAQATANARPRTSFVQALLDFIGRMASGPQVAMATITMLVVAVGLWQLPALQHLPSGQGVTVVSPDPEGEAAPSGGLAPAAPLDLTVDARSRRIRSREELAAAASNAYAKDDAPVEPATAEEQVVVAMAEEPPPPEEKLAINDDPLGGLGDMEDVIAPARSAGEGVAEKSARSASAAASTDAKAGAGARLGRKSKSAFPENDGFAAAEASAAPAKASASAARPAAPKPVSVTDDFAQSAAREDRGASAKQETSTALSRARDARASKGCASALILYEEAAKNVAMQGTALLELAACQRELGRIAAARTTLERAVAMPQVATRAQSMLDELPREPAKATPMIDSAPAAAPAP